MCSKNKTEKEEGTGTQERALGTSLCTGGKRKEWDPKIK